MLEVSLSVILHLFSSFGIKIKTNNSIKTINTDKNLIKITLQNLLENAVKYSPNNNKINEYHSKLQVKHI